MNQNVLTPVASTASVAEDLLLSLATTDPQQFKIFFRQIRRTHARQSLRLALRYLAEKGADECARCCILPWLLRTDYVDGLLDPELVNADTAHKSAELMASEDPQFFLRFLQLMKGDAKDDRGRMQRALMLADKLSDASALIPWLKALITGTDERLRSQAVKVICKLRANPALICRQLESPDYRVRANAIEALWGIQNDEVRDVLHKALEDVHHRVVINALVGLHYQNDPTALRKILEYVHHPFEMHRAAAIWAIGLLGELSAIPALMAVMASDPSAHVRQKASAILDKLNSKAKAVTPAA